MRRALSSAERCRFCYSIRLHFQRSVCFNWLSTSDGPMTQWTIVKSYNDGSIPDAVRVQVPIDPPWHQPPIQSNEALKQEEDPNPPRWSSQARPDLSRLTNETLPSSCPLAQHGNDQLQFVKLFGESLVSSLSSLTQSRLRQPLPDHGHQNHVDSAYPPLTQEICDEN